VPQTQSKRQPGSLSLTRYLLARGTAAQSSPRPRIPVRWPGPLCLAVPLALGWLLQRGVGSGVFAERVGSWWIAAATVAGLLGMVSWCAHAVSRAERKRRAVEAQLAELASRDPLTGLFNRHRFEEELDQLLARVRRYRSTGALLLVELDRMKVLNDTLGHGAGDQLLSAVADVVRGRLRETDVVARVGGGELAVLLLEAGPAAAVEVADQLRAMIAQIRIETRDGSCWSSASIGVAPIDATPGLGSSELLGRADAACYRARRAGGDHVELTEGVSTLASREL
jgi:diguanylate cyclase (GGDEF)-like protein